MATSQRGARTGHLRVPITLERATVSQDTFGEEDPTWSTLANRSAKKEPMTGRELERSGLSFADHPTLFTFRYGADISDLSTEDRIVDGGVTYDLVSVINVEDRNEWFECVGAVRG